MNSLNVSLDEFPALFDKPIEGKWEYYVPVQERTELQQLIGGEAIQRDLSDRTKRDLADRLKRVYDVLNTRRLKSLESIDEKPSFCCIQQILEFFLMDEFMLELLSDGHLGKDDNAAVRSLLTYAEWYSEFYALRSACLIRSAQVFEQYGRQNDATRLYKAFFNVQWLSNDSYHPCELYNRFVAHIEARQPNLFSDLVPDFEPRSDLPSELVEGLHLMLRKNGIALTDRILKQVQPAISFKPSEETPQIGGSRLGGLPDVPEGWEWPDELLFLGQFNMEEVAPYDVKGLLPKQGLLQFFFLYDIGAQDDGWSHVCFHEGDLSLLKPAIPPPSFKLDSYGEDAVFLPLLVEPYSTISMLSPDAFYGGKDQDFMKALSLIYPKFSESHEHNNWGIQLLGSTSFSRTHASIDAWVDDAERNSRVLTKEDVLNSEHEWEQWILLFQAFSCREIGFDLSQGSFAHYMIHKNDLVSRRFDRVYFSE